MALLASLGKIGPLAASQCGFLAGGMVSYALNGRFTFRARVAHRRALPRYVLATAIGWAINGAILVLLRAMMDNILLAQAGATTAVAMSSFMLQRQMVFTRGDRRDE